MKLLQSCSFLAAVVVAAMAPHAIASPNLVTSPVDKVFVPQGFDDNDNVEVILHGTFPNTCYKTGPSSAQIDTEAMTITIKASSYSYSGESLVCAQVMIPFIQTVNLGVVEKGTYKLVVTDRPEATARDLEVAAALSPAPDDFLYAPADTVAVRRNADGQDVLALEGRYPHMFIGCMQISELRTSLTSDNVLVVQPITTILDDSACSGFDYKVEKTLTTVLPEGDYLIHVRTLDGTAINRFFTR